MSLPLHKFTFFFAFMLFAGQSFAQSLVSFDNIANYTVSGVKNLLDYNDLQGESLAKYDIRLYRVTFQSINQFGKPELVEGIISIPEITCDQIHRIGLTNHTSSTKVNQTRPQTSWTNPILFATKGHLCVQVDNFTTNKLKNLDSLSLVQKRKRHTIDLIKAASELIDILNMDIHFSDEIYVSEDMWSATDEEINHDHMDQQNIIPATKHVYKKLLQTSSPCSTLNIANSSPIPYKIFPNPTDGKIFIEHPEGTKELNIYAFNISGKEIDIQIEKSKGRYEINIPEQQGLILIQIFKGQEFIGTARVDIER